MSDFNFTTHGNEPLEARIVSWVLGEASAFEVDELERLCQEQPELAVFKRRMEAVHGLVAEAHSHKDDARWKLSLKKRSAIEDLIGAQDQAAEELVRDYRASKSGRRALLAIAACLVLTVVVATLTWPIFFVTGNKSSGEASLLQEVDSIIGYSYEAAPQMDNRSGDRSVLGKEAKRMVPFSDVAGELPSELIEGTPKPMKVPGLVDPSGDSRMRSLAKKEGKPSSPSASVAKVITSTAVDEIGIPSPQVEVTSPSVDFGASSSFGEGWGSASIVGEVTDGANQAGSVNYALRDAKNERFERNAPSARRGSSATEGREKYRGGGGGVKQPLDGFDAPELQPAPTEEMTHFYANLGARGALPGNSVVGGLANTLGSVEGPLEGQQLKVGRESGQSGKDNQSYDDLAFANQGAFKSKLDPKKEDSFFRQDKLDRVESELSQKGEKGPSSNGLSPEGLTHRELIEGNVNLKAEGEKKLAQLESLTRKEAEDADSPTQVDIVTKFVEIQQGNQKELGFDWEAKLVDEEVSKELAENNKDEDKLKERKRPIVTEEETVAADEPYSTFSLNINDASFRIAQAALAKGELPDPTGIKVEQFYNAVDYGDPSPAAGQPVASKIEQSAHPIIPGRNLVRVSIKTASEGRNQGQPLRLTLLIDQSGSMAREDRRQAMTDALQGLRGLLSENDQVNVIGFSRTPRLLAEAVKGKQGQLANLVNIEANEGGTNLEEAIKLGQQLAERYHLEGAQNRLVLFTDGAANLGDADPDSLADKIKELRQKDIAFDIAGIVADGLNDDLLGEMARHGNGRYYVVGKGEKDRFAQQLAGAFRPAAENVKVQVHFNPERVSRYKLIGFEKDRLNKEDFHDDTVDAAEMAAEEAGVAIYQVETLPEGEGEVGEVSVRFRDVASGEMVERSWTIANEIATSALDQARPSMQFATLAMMVGEKLKGGPLADAINFNDMGEVIAQVRRHYKGDPKAAEMLQMIEQLK